MTAYPEEMGHFAGEGFSGVKLPVHHNPSDAPKGLDAIEEVVNEAHSLIGEQAEVVIKGHVASNK